MNVVSARPSRPTPWHRIAALLASILLLLPTAIAQDSQDTPAPTTAIPAHRQASTLAVISIKGGIDRWTSVSVQRRIQEANALGADGIVIEIDTPGGEMWSFIEICDAIKDSPVPNTIAWVNQRAISAGAFIALAASETVVHANATYGDAAPILIGPAGIQQMNETERAKMLSVPLAKLIDSARRNGYDEKLVQGFISLGVELWLVEHSQTGQRLFITEDEYRVLFDGEPSRLRATIGELPPTSSDTPAESEAIPPPTSPYDVQPASPELAAAASESPELGAFSTNETLERNSIPSNRPLLSASDKDSYTLVEYVTDGSTILTLNTNEILRYGLAEAVVSSEAELQQFTGASNIIHLDMNWSEKLARFLSYMPVQGVLIVVFLLGMFIEMSAPGVGLPGGIALLALAGLVAPQFVAGAAAWWGIVVMLAGLGLIAVEIFVIPGFGLFGVGGLAALFAGLLGIVLGPAGMNPHTEADWIYAISTVLLALASTGIGMYFVVKHHKSFPGLRNLVLTGRVDQFDEEQSIGMLAAMAEPEAKVRKGDEGIAITPLRPAGTAEFNGALADVVTERGFINQGTRVRVVECGGMRIAVEPIEDDPRGLFEDTPDPDTIDPGPIEELDA
ncbi:MAG: NfeD family protein [Planctomycetota bacterium]|jgi:membrane-bound serine protease (ClpP class)